MNGERQSRLTRSRKRDFLEKRAFGTLAGPSLLICLAAIVPGLLLLRTAGPDLSELTPNAQHMDGYVLVAWYDLARGHQALREGEPSAGSPTRALGYMMEGDPPIRDGQFVQRFVLLPDAGIGIHPAHRFGDQMIEVRLEAPDTVRFSEASLVWAWGTWRPLPGDPNRDRPLYELENAHVERATKADISKYFR